jgi:hypothetical protein
MSELSENKDIYKNAVQRFGDRAQTDKAIEEMSELTKALLKLRYCSKDYEREILLDAVAEEMADTEIMLEQLKIIHENRKAVEAQKRKKLERLERLIR